MVRDVYILSCCLQAEKKRNSIWKENILVGGKSKICLSVDLTMQTMKSLQANPECQLLNANSLLPALNKLFSFC